MSTREAKRGWEHWIDRKYIGQIQSDQPLQWEDLGRTVVKHGIQVRLHARWFEGILSWEGVYLTCFEFSRRGEIFLWLLFGEWKLVLLNFINRSLLDHFGNDLFREFWVDLLGMSNHRSIRDVLGGAPIDRARHLRSFFLVPLQMSCKIVFAKKLSITNVASPSRLRVMRVLQVPF